MPVDDRYLHSDITDRIIACIHSVRSALGPGFAEKLYENALVVELQTRGLSIKQQHPIRVYYKDILIGEYVADLLVEEKVIVELKALEALSELHDAQIINYLKLSGIRVGLLVNFGSRKLEWRRKIV